MAQYYTDFNDDAVGDQPANTTLKRNAVTGDYTKQENSGESVLRYLASSGGSTARGLSYDGYQSSGETEFITNVINVDQNNSARIVLFASDSPDNEYGCYVNPGASFGSRIVAYQRVSGSFSLLGNGSLSVSDTGHYNMRFKVIPGSPNEVKVRVWADGDAEPSVWSIETTSSSLTLASGWSGHVGFAENETLLYTSVGIGTNGDPAPTAPVGPGGDEQDVTLVSGQQITQTTAVDVNQVAAINAIVASQQTQSQAAPVQQVAALSSIDGQQATEADQSNIALTALLGAIEAQQVSQAVSVEISTAAVMDITTVLLEQVTQTQVVTVDQVAQAAAVIAQQLTQGAPLSAEQIADLAAVVVEQITRAQAVDVSIVQPDDLTVAVIEQLTQAQSTPVYQSAQVTGLSAESRTEVQAISLASDYSLVTTPVQQSTQTQIVELLDGTGLNVVTLEQATQAQVTTVDLTLLVGTVTGEQAMEGQTSVVAATLLLSAVDVEQLTEAEIADILGSAMLVDPRTLRVKRTTVGYTVNRITDSFRVKFKATVH